MFDQYFRAPNVPLNYSVCSRWVILCPHIEDGIPTFLSKHFDLENTIAKTNSVSINVSKFSLGLLKH